jgi:hypothetical protein
MVTRRYHVLLAENVRRYQTITVESDVDLERLLNDTRAEDPVPEAVLTVVNEGEVVREDYGEAEHAEFDVSIEEVEEVQVPEPVQVPYSPTNRVQAEAWVQWAVETVGLGWHPDTSGDNLMHFTTHSLTAVCQCGETFIPNDESDTTHAYREDGEECGLTGVITGAYGHPTPLFPDPDVCRRYDDGLAAAHRLLPDIYSTAMFTIRSLGLLNPEGHRP